MADDSAKPVKRSLTIAGHRTSISLEEAFWTALQDVARIRGIPVSTLISGIDAARGRTNLSSAIRVYLLEHFRSGNAGG
jgi:predicted DNA-binding ribbon-helix-helix protein